MANDRASIRQQQWDAFKKATAGMSRAEIDDWMESKRKVKPQTQACRTCRPQPKPPTPPSTVKYVYVEDKHGGMVRSLCPPPLGLARLKEACAKEGRKVEVREESRPAS